VIDGGYKGKTKFSKKHCEGNTRCFKSVTKVLQGCSKSDIGVLQRCARVIQGVASVLHKGVTQGCYTRVSHKGVTQMCYTSVLHKCSQKRWQGCQKDMTRLSQQFHKDLTPPLASSSSSALSSSGTVAPSDPILASPSFFTAFRTLLGTLRPLCVSVCECV
jgi:hypothetical protein